MDGPFFLLEGFAISANQGLGKIPIGLSNLLQEVDTVTNQENKHTHKIVNLVIHSIEALRAFPSQINHEYLAAN